MSTSLRTKTHRMIQDMVRKLRGCEEEAEAHRERIRELEEELEEREEVYEDALEFGGQAGAIEGVGAVIAARHFGR